MKKLLTTLAIAAFTFVGTSVNAEARDGRGYSQQSSKTYVSGYRHGRPIYTQKYVTGRDRYGNVRWGYRTVSSSNYRSSGRSSSYRRSGYNRGYRGSSCR